MLEKREVTHIEIEDTLEGVWLWVIGLYESGRFPDGLHLGGSYHEDSDGWRISIVKTRPPIPDQLSDWHELVPPAGLPAGIEDEIQPLQVQERLPEDAQNALIETGPVGTLQAQRMGEQRVLTLLTLIPAEGEDFQRLVDVFIEESEGQTTQPAARKAIGGRPSNADDDWAWEQINDLKRSKAQVYQEWLNRIGDRAKTLADTRDSFNKAIKPNRGKKRKKSE